MGLKNFLQLFKLRKSKNNSKTTRSKAKAKKINFIGKVIYKTQDELGLIQVVDDSISRSLHFNSPVEQSKVYFHSPLNLAFEYQQKTEELIIEINAKRSINSILMLGVGGGTLATKLNLLLPQTQMTLVDNRHKVLQIAYDYFSLPKVKQIKTLCADAYDFVFATQQNYDLIIVDTYDSAAMPNKFIQDVFLEQLLKIKHSQGHLIFNLWQSTPTPTIKVIKFYEEKGQLDLIDIKSSSNLILSFPAS